MRIEKELNISASEFYDKIMSSVVMDVRKATGKNLSRKQLRNFEYVKQFSRNASARIKIEEVEEDRTYQFRTSTVKNVFVARYDVQAEAADRCKVIYTENMESFGFFQQMNDTVIGALTGFLKKRRFKKMLEMIEQA